MLKKVKGGWKLYSKSTGKPLSKKPKSKEAAQRQERAIQAAKAKRRKG